jgi:Putative transposase
MTLPAQEVIRRFLQHVWPQGFHKVRYYGLWSPVPRPLLHHLQLCLAGHDPSAALQPPGWERQPPTCQDAPLQAGQLCPHCGEGLLVVIRRLPRYQRAPPCATEPSCGLPRPASSGPLLPPTAALYHLCALLPHTMAGTPLFPRPAILVSHPRPGPSPLCPPLWTTTTPRINSRICFQSDSGDLKIPYKLARRFRSTAFLCRLRATKTLLR